jgi:hypothetical protein
MGMNYYLKHPACGHCGRSGSALHIGKSSAGWCFALHVDDERKSLDDWQKAWSQPGAIIENEYGEAVTPEQMLAKITDRSWPDDRDRTDRFLCENHAAPGPNNLLRHQLGPYCVGHGDGTYDLIPGEFS